MDNSIDIMVWKHVEEISTPFGVTWSCLSHGNMFSVFERVEVGFWVLSYS
jgi:hypothetical protein